MMDQNLPATGAPSSRWRRWLSPLVVTFLATLLINLLLVHLVFDVLPPSSDNDPAGNGMTSAFSEVLRDAMFFIAGLLAILFLLVRWTWFRIGEIVLLWFGNLLLLFLYAVG